MRLVGLIVILLFLTACPSPELPPSEQPPTDADAIETVIRMSCVDHVSGDPLQANIVGYFDSGMLGLVCSESGRTTTWTVRTHASVPTAVRFTGAVPCAVSPCPYHYFDATVPMRSPHQRSDAKLDLVGTVRFVPKSR